ncbi:MAG: hypothetical protein HY257_02680 [Chloroflexi bacterium]|nr:hypothetical protein [Chloroflexota bacterium]
MRVALFLITASPFIFFALFHTERARAQSGNLLQDSTFDAFYNQGDGSSGAWKPFKLTNPGPTIWKHLTEGWPKGPSVWIYGDANQFDGGVFQTVSVSAGKGYHFEIAWAVVRYAGANVCCDSKLVRQVGIDPYGATEPRAPNIIWSDEYRGSGKFAPELAVDAHARANQITVYLRARNEYPDSRAEVFFDTATLEENGAPPIAIAPPTATQTSSAITRASATIPRPRVANAATLTPTASRAITETRTPTETRAPRATSSAPVEESNGSFANLALPFAVGGCLLIGILALAGVGFFLLAKQNA